MFYPSSENKGADQLRGYREADLRLCFRLCRLLVFPCGGSFILGYFCFGPTTPPTDWPDSYELKFEVNINQIKKKDIISPQCWVEVPCQRTDSPVRLKIKFCLFVLYLPTHNLSPYSKNYIAFSGGKIFLFFYG